MAAFSWENPATTADLDLAHHRIYIVKAYPKKISSRFHSLAGYQLAQSHLIRVSSSDQQYVGQPV